MKKHLALIAVLLLAMSSSADAARIYWRSALIGSSAGALDSISKAAATPGVPLASGDSAVVIAGETYFYTFDAAMTAAESSPAVIAPDDAGPTGRWLRVPSFLLASDISGLATVATSGSYSDLIGTPTTITTQQAADIASNNAARHSHVNLAAIAAVTDAGSGAIISSTERANLGTAYSHSQAAHAPSTAEQNVNADWSAPLGGDDYIANKPVIPTNNNQLTNGAGYITGYTESDPGVATHNSTTLSVHGITDTSAVVLSNDIRLTDARTPTAHSQDWSTITATPTTLAGYGITDGGGTTLTTDQEAAITGAALPSAANVFATIADVLAGGSYTDEAAQDATGAMVTGNTETGIAVTYDDTANKLNFDASHNHTGTYAPVLGVDDNYVTDAEKAALHQPVTGTDGVSVTGQDIANTDKGSTAITTHNSAFAHADIATNTTHRTSTGADHTWLGQDLRTTATPTFAGLNVDGPDGGRSVSLLNNTVAVPCIAGDYRLYPQNGTWKKCEDGTITDVGAGTGGDMLKSTYDANADNLIDDAAIAASIARDSEIPTNNNQLTNGAGYLTSYTETDPTAEPALGNPASDGLMLSSTAAGVRSWVAGGGGGGDVVSDTTPQLGGVLDLNGKPLAEVFTAGEALVAGDVCYYGSDGKMWKTDANATATASSLLGISTGAVSADTTGAFIVFGSAAYTGLTTGASYYLSETAGGITSTIPTTAGVVIRPLGTALSTTVLFFNPSSTWIVRN